VQITEGAKSYTAQSDTVEFIDCTACNIKRLEAVYTFVNKVRSKVKKKKETKKSAPSQASP
jgi:hypothetical protein